ncbi:PDZ domain-containing protein [Pseudemcibacter aquimaris]|uniref:PDZ domain-containing protein n=1 Tax=Pseudemcibacter aquimaris TaxID=2857064 RepID=UPI002011A485|nr:PDZ domain-containing protein [Pseudemcibacter aquimaris]MCC3859881.1 PDZ domain-containing protein [Pseudemcibacter aquimaris]WDU57213.1 PDZ domain-containing protein [Pseudemcibacter aquimaris]
MMRLLLVLLSAVLLSACGAGQFGSSYQGYMDPRMTPDVVPLKEEEEPILVRSTDLAKDIQLYREHNYIVVGESAFNGMMESEGRAQKQAEEVGATHVIVSSEYTDTRSYIAYDYQDFYRTVYVNRVKNIDGKPVRYTEAVTVRDTVTVPYQRQYDNYDQWAVYMVKSNRIHKLGLVMRDFNPNERASLGRNTGAYIDVVMSNSPAFFADIIAGDALVAINGEKVNGAGHAKQMIDGLSLEGQEITVTVLKQGQPKDIVFEFNE